MKILNSKKTHFMQPNTVGTYNVKFGTVSEVRAVIDTILDGNKDNKIDGNLRVVDTESTEKPNH